MSRGDAPLYELILTPSGRRGRVREGETLLEAAESLGIDLESICGGRQTCGKCVIEPEFGKFPKHGIDSRPEHLTPVDEAERQCADEHGVRLPEQRIGCAARIRGDLLVDVPDASLARKQVIRKHAGDLQLEVNPALRLAYVEIGPPSMSGPSDVERLQQALQEQWSLGDVGVDPTLLPQVRAALREGDGRATLTLWLDREVVRIEPGYQDGLYGLAVDIGSTTIAAHLSDLRTGSLVASAAEMNPQVRYGEDLMSRVSYAMMEAQGTERMHRSVVRAVNQLAQEAASEAGVEPGEICQLVLVGNSVMHHLALGIDPTDLGSAPFALTVRQPLDVRARDFGYDRLHAGARLYVPPCIAGHVGADCAAVLLSQVDTFDDQVTLVVDVGTNAEIMLAKGDRLLVASSPTGPALEGAQIQYGQRAATGAVERVRIDPESARVRYRVVGDERWSDELEADESLRPSGICGSGILEVVGELFAAGWLDRSGRLIPDAAVSSGALRATGRTAELILAPAAETALDEDLVITQNDIRAVQLAKAALYAGARLLMDHLGVESVDRVRLAGAFGTTIDPKYALLIGLVPDCRLEAVTPIGNAAGDGARIALLNRDKQLELQKIVDRVEYVETAIEPRFQEHFVDAMALPHKRDPFPHLNSIFPNLAERQMDSAEGRKLDRNGRRRRRRSESRKIHD